MYVPAIASVLLSYAALVAAQDQTVTVNVGATTSTQGGAFQFIPDNINATEGSVVTFKFSGVPGNHSITQSSLTSPCQPLPNGFDSGFVFLTSATETPTWNLTITNGTQPIWFYCKQLAPSPHCLAGMVGAINAPQSTFAQFQQAATSSSGNPGQNEGGLVGVGASASAPPSPLTGAVTGFGNPTGASGASPPSPSSSSSSSSSSNTASAPGSSQSSSAQTFEASGLLMTFAALLLGIA